MSRHIFKMFTFLLPFALQLVLSSVSCLLHTRHKTIWENLAEAKVLVVLAACSFHLVFFVTFRASSYTTYRFLSFVILVFSLFQANRGATQFLSRLEGLGSALAKAISFGNNSVSFELPQVREFRRSYIYRSDGNSRRNFV